MSEFDFNLITALYCDGGVIGKNPSPHGITWAFCGVDENNRRILEAGGYVVSPPGRLATNNWSEQIAIVKALEAMPAGWSGLVCSDSRIALGRVFQDWSTKNLPRNVIERSRQAVARLGCLRFLHLQGHPTKEDLARGIGAKRGLPVSIHNVWVDEECGRQKKLYFKDKK